MMFGLILDHAHSFLPLPDGYLIPTVADGLGESLGALLKFYFRLNSRLLIWSSTVKSPC
jgi:hypothetical protein